MFYYEIVQENNRTLIKFEGDLDIDSTELIEEELIPKLQQQSEIMIHFGQVEFVDSSGMGLLLTLMQSLIKEGKHIRIMSVREEVMEVFELLQIPAILGEQTFVR